MAWQEAFRLLSSLKEWDGKKKRAPPLQSLNPSTATGDPHPNRRALCAANRCHGLIHQENKSSLAHHHTSFTVPPPCHAQILVVCGCCLLLSA